MYLKKETIKKGQPMPCICEICSNVSSVKKEDGRDIKEPCNNSCFLQRTINGKPYSIEYAPFTNSKRKINIDCKNFSHVKSITTRL